MTPIDRFERQLPLALTDLAAPRTPDYLTDILGLTNRTRQRSAWASLERWLPVDLVTQRAPVARLPWRQLGVLALIAILVAALLVAYVGSRRQRLPPPFGVAANGVIAYVTTTGDIAVGDPLAGSARVVVSAVEPWSYPVFSRDGTRLAFTQRADGKVNVSVVPTVGGRPREVARVAAASVGLLTFSPDGSKIAFAADQTLWIANSDGSGGRDIRLDVAVDSEIEWRPPDGRQLMIRGVRDGKAGLFLLDSDGANARAVTPIDGGLDDYLWLTFSPDGGRVAYSTHPAKQVHVLSIDTRADTMLQPADGLDLMFPRWSPDGRQFSFMVWHRNGATQIGVAPADDPRPVVTLTGPIFDAPGNGIQHEWSPDGRQIIAVRWGSDQPWLLDPMGGPGKPLNLKAEFPDWIEWQRLAP